ncbi:MAG: type II toxin-antitoxin system YafQ family toxin [Chlamydiae bacterium]|nr:type II toxin-antitoxin system YafQ family toxin [Chlamydiota bacterium]MBI3276970.1 type II toxin-antitoxin system YafQ family toxin [Chlamydiota bacterium]
MLVPVYTRQFERDIKKLEKRRKDINQLREVLQKLILKESLDSKYRDHKLRGSFTGRRDCHIEPDWLLIYKLTEGQVIFERTGTHSDLFR